MTIPFILPDVVDAVKELQADLAFFFPQLTHFYGYASTPDHNSHRCLDAMVYDSSGKYVAQQGRKNLSYAERIALGDKVNAFLRKNADHYHLNGVIWNRHVWGFPHDGGTGSRHYAGPVGVARPYTITAHDDHNHIELDGRPFVPLRPRTYLPPFVVDPEKVSTTLQGLDFASGDVRFEREPGFRITTAVDVVDLWGRQRVRTEADVVYALEFLVPESEFKARPAEVEVPKLTTIRVATFNVLSDASGIAGGEGSFASRIDRIITVLKASKASVLLLQECNAARAADIQGRLGPDWVWSRANARTVMVNKTVWTMGDERVREMPTPYSKTDKTWPLVQLTHRAGDVVWFASVHFSSTSPYKAIATSAQMAAERKQQAESIVTDLDAYRWVVGGGDHNSSSLTAGTPKAVLLAAGFSLLTQDVDFDSADVDSFLNSTPGGQQIDDIWCKGGLSITDGAIIPSVGGSDHNLMVAELTIDKRT